MAYTRKKKSDSFDLNWSRDPCHLPGNSSSHSKAGLRLYSSEDTKVQKRNGVSKVGEGGGPPIERREKYKKTEKNGIR